MPIKIPDSLPARATLEGENIFVMTEYRAIHQDMRPLNLLILNLMPTKIVTETQLLRKLSNSPLQVQVELLQMSSHTSQNTDADHLSSFYTTFEKIKETYYGSEFLCIRREFAEVMLESEEYEKSVVRELEKGFGMSGKGEDFLVIGLR